MGHAATAIVSKPILPGIEIGWVDALVRQEFRTLVAWKSEQLERGLASFGQWKGRGDLFAH
jgi:hypothetical protein